MAHVQCIVVTPERTVLDREAEFVALPLYDGEIGIAPGHTPLIGRLGCGELRVRDAQSVDRLYVEGGFVQVLEGVVSVLTGKAVPGKDLDEAVAEEQLDAARARPANTPDLMTQRDQAVTQARAQLRVARRARP